MRRRRGSAHHAGPPGSILRFHRSGAGTCRPQRVTSAGKRCCLPGCSVPASSGWRPWTISEKRGFMKTLIDAHSDRILGFTAFGPEAGELMGTVQLAMLAGLPYTTLRDAMFAHPTMTEGLKALFTGVPQLQRNHAEQFQHAREPPIYFRSTTMVRLPSSAIVQAANLPPVPAPSTRTSYSSAAFMSFIPFGGCLSP